MIIRPLNNFFRRLALRCATMLKSKAVKRRRQAKRCVGQTSSIKKRRETSVWLARDGKRRAGEPNELHNEMREGWAECVDASNSRSLKCVLLLLFLAVIRCSSLCSSIIADETVK